MQGLACWDWMEFLWYYMYLLLFSISLKYFLFNVNRSVRHDGFLSIQNNFNIYQEHRLAVEDTTRMHTVAYIYEEKLEIMCRITVRHYSKGEALTFFVFLCFLA